MRRNQLGSRRLGAASSLGPGRGPRPWAPGVRVLDGSSPRLPFISGRKHLRALKGLGGEEWAERASEEASVIAVDSALELGSHPAAPEGGVWIKLQELLPARPPPQEAFLPSVTWLWPRKCLMLLLLGGGVWWVGEAQEPLGDSSPQL